eukprot:CAMPEP_0115295656 /NCGR_PEP_ID=MMETSP0270-20121206/66827_1 /TAXON_ID=71861 /ORGANISM="Scrippsiella trochoidea, Strain CCMP3099" /LENGTH=55 /DNA_ID=CAMNT_0002713253 /DNA_START=320 /DNA_END=487 /DNA_ORIENTATION=-
MALVLAWAQGTHAYSQMALKCAGVDGLPSIDVYSRPEYASAISVRRAAPPCAELQ